MKQKEKHYRSSAILVNLIEGFINFINWILALLWGLTVIGITILIYVLSVLLLLSPCIIALGIISYMFGYRF